MNLSTEEDCCAICIVEFSEAVENEVLMVEASLSMTLPVGVLLQTIVMPKSINVGNFLVIFRVLIRQFASEVDADSGGLSLHEWDVGLTKGVSHHIKIIDFSGPSS